MSIRLDSTKFSVVVVCSCGWRTVTHGDRTTGWQIGAEHERRTHGNGDGNAARAAWAADYRAGGS